MKKRVISLFIAISLLLSMLPQIALSTNATETQKGDGWGNWSDYVDVNTVIVYPVEGGNLYFGQENPEWSNVDKTKIDLLCADSTVTSAQIPETINGMTVSGISEYAFGSSYLKSVYIPATVEFVWGSSFFGCTSLEEIIIADGNPNCYMVDGVLYTKGFNDWTNTEILSLELYLASKEDSEFAVPHGVTSIAYGAFGDAANLRSISIPDSVRDIQPGAFGEWSSNVNFTDIYYESSDEKWKEILVGGDYGYDTIDDTLIHFNRYEPFPETIGSNSDWNAIYYEYIVQSRNNADFSPDWEWVEYELVYLDDDTIPELWITYPAWAYGCRLVFIDGNTVSEEILSMGGLSYNEYNNCFFHSGGKMDVYFDTVYKLENGTLATIAEGQYEVTWSNDGTSSSTAYFWNDSSVSEKEYANKLNNLVDSSTAKQTDSEESKRYSYDEILDYLSSVKLEDTAELKVYTTFPYATLGVDQTAKLLITLLVNGEPTPIQELSLENNNPVVIDLVDTQDTDGMQVLTFRALSPGIVCLTFTEDATGATISIEIAVEDMCSYYRCSNFPIPDASSFPIHVADFRCTENADGTHDVKFNAYNTSYAYGAAVVYDETGAFWGCVPLNPKYDGTGMEYIANGFWQSWEQTWYWIDGDKEFYEVAGNAMLTEVAFNSIPQNAKIVVTADGRESTYPVLYTGIDIFLKVAFYSANIDLKIDIYQKSVKEFVAALLKALPADAAQNTIQTLTTDISMALIDGVNSESVKKIYQAVWNMFENIGLNADEMIKNVLSGLGYSVADTVVIAAVPAYSFVDLVNKIVAVAWLFVDYDSNLDRGNMEIHCVKHASNNQLINSSVVVVQQSEFSNDTILDAYVVTDADELGKLPASVISDIKNYSVYNITLRESGAEIQPSEEIEIRVPIPENVNPDKCVIYRLEKDGTLTLLPSITENGYAVFTTTHLSYYIVGESTDETAEDISTNFENNSTWIWIVCGVAAIGVIALVIIIRRKKSNA